MYLQNLAFLKIIQKIFVFISYLTDWYSCNQCLHYMHVYAYNGVIYITRKHGLFLLEKYTNLLTVLYN